VLGRPQKHVWRAQIVLLTAEGCGVATLTPQWPRTSLNGGQAAKSRLWRSLEGSFGLADACSLPSRLSLGCIGKGHRGIQYP
jgi:hypothetical protein